MTTSELVEGHMYDSPSGDRYKITEKRAVHDGWIVQYVKLSSTGEFLRSGGRTYKNYERWSFIPIVCVIEEDDYGDLEMHALPYKT